MTFILIALIAYLITLVITPFVAKAARKFGFVDRPDRDHPAILHTQTVPRAGGVAIYLSILLTVILSYFLFRDNQNIGEPFDYRIVAVLIGGFIAVLIGTIDDKFDLSPFVRLI